MVGLSGLGGGSVWGEVVHLSGVKGWVCQG